MDAAVDLEEPMEIRTVVGVVLAGTLLAGCGVLSSLMPGSSGAAQSTESTSASSTSYSRSTTVEEINGQPVGQPAQEQRAAQQRGGAGFGATCTAMDDCESRLCFIGRAGNVGFC